MNVTPLTGSSPLTVSFKGNAITSSEIVEYCCPDCNFNDVEDAQDIEDGNSLDANLDGIPDECCSGDCTLTTNFIPCPTPVSIDDASRCSGWDFEDDGTIDTFQTTTSHTYTADPDGASTQNFTARLKFTDIAGLFNSEAITMIVRLGTDGGGGGSGDLSIAITEPGASGTTINSGTAPLDVVVNVDVSDVPGTFQSVSWDLGDGTVADSLSVTHTYENTSTAAIVVPITVTVFTSVPSGDSSGGYSASTQLTVLPEGEGPPVGNGNINGSGIDGDGSSGGSPCSSVPLTAMVGMMLGLALMRRRFVRG